VELYTIKQMIDSFDREKLQLTAFNIKEGNSYHSITYGDLQHHIKAVGNALLKMGIKKGDKIGLLSENRINWPVVYLAVMSIGSIIVPIDIFWKDRELVTVTQSSDLSMIFVSNRYMEKILNLKSRLKNSIPVVCFDENKEIYNEINKKVGKKKDRINKKNFNEKIKVLNDKELEKDIAFKGYELIHFNSVISTGKQLMQKGMDKYQDMEVDPADIAQVLFVSAKMGIMLSHEAIIHANNLVKTLEPPYEAQEQWLTVIPFSRIYPTVFGIFTPLLTYNTGVSIPTSKIEIIFQTIKETGANYVTLVPLLLEKFYNHIKKYMRNGESSLKELGLSSIRGILVGGAPCPVELIESIETLGFPVIQAYGLSEMPPALTLNTFKNHKPGSVGIPMKNVRVKIDNPDAMGNGEVLARGPGAMKGYYNPSGDPDELNLEGGVHFDNQGWLHTGDIGKFDNDGFLYITGRSRNIIIGKAGINIYPGEIKEILLQSHCISDVEILRKIDKETGEYPYAVIQPDIEFITGLERKSNKKFSDEEIKDLIREELNKLSDGIADYKLPRDFEITHKKISNGLKKDKIFMFKDQERPGKKTLGKNIKSSYIENYLAGIVAGISGMGQEEIDKEANFLDLLDSVGLVRMLETMKNEIQIKLYPPILFEYKNIKELSDYLAGKFSPQLGIYFGDAIKQENLIEEAGKEKKNIKKVNIHEQIKEKDFKGMKEKVEGDPIAIIGASGIFPASNDLEEFWNNLEQDKCLISEIPGERFDWRQYYGDAKPGSNKMITRWGGFIDDIDKFDPSFFNISPKEAEFMDPQQRKFLEVVWKTIEDAGYKPSSLSNTRTGLFVGVFTSDYSELMLEKKVALEAYSATGTMFFMFPNRISYLLNLRGPSETIDTACSSSLTAVHRAIQTIRLGECEMAIAGGVNALITPKLFIANSSAGMLSPDGRCKTFNKGANGYVRGEGAGAVFLKPLSKALEHGDHIYALIKGTAINHGGRSNSLTAPNPAAQAELLVAAYENANVSPGNVTYIEAHGTGTELGDPVEVSGLIKAFEVLYKRNGKSLPGKAHCGLGSVKTNIGHLEAASGIAGLIKVLLSMKNKKLPGTVGFKELNPYINLQGSPFYIVEKTRPWECLEDEKGKNLPRLAGISSFGAGGVNAHVILEEYIPRAEMEKSSSTTIGKGPRREVIPLSAKNKERLKAYMQKISTFLKQHQETDICDMAYTLQIGREAMEERVVFLVKDIAELEEKLEQYIQGTGDSTNCFKGNAKKGKKVIQLFTADEALQEAVKKWFAKGKIKNLAELWVDGLDLNWDLLPRENKPKRISLPTYPFAGERYWVPESDTSPKTSPFIGSFIHPLLHQNTSDLYQQRFTSTFTNREFFLGDHVVQGIRILPGAACLEMARAALDQAGAFKESRSENPYRMRLKDVVWADPIAVGDRPMQVQIGLFPQNNRDRRHVAIAYEIYSEPEKTGAASVVHSQGTAEPGSEKEVPILDLSALQNNGAQYILSAAQWYEILKANGINYNPAYMGIEMIYAGQNQVLARLGLPSPAADTSEQFVLHPCLLDSALQAAMVLRDAAFFKNPGGTGPSGEKALIKPVIPCSMKELEILGRCSTAMWALVKYSNGDKPGSKGLLDITLCDDSGVICIEMKGLETYSSSEMELSPGTVNNIKIQAHEHPGETAVIEAKAMESASIEHLKELMTEATKIPTNRLAPDAFFEELGLDSIIIANLNKEVEKWVGKLDATLFFKYNTIRSLGAYLAETYPDAVRNLVNVNRSKTKESHRNLSYMQKIPTPTSIHAAKSQRKMISSIMDMYKCEDIAVIGIAGRFPRARTLDQFWENLYKGKDCVGEIPPDRWSLDGFFEPDRIKAVEKGLSYSKWGGFLDDVDCFDSLFFNIAPKDAMFMDPHERLFLETAWECLEDAGYTRKSLEQDGYGSRTGVFAGATFNDYQLYMAEAANRANKNMYAGTGQIFSISNRVSFVMNFSGPSLTLDTACASSLYAIHLACESIRKGESHMAIAGGVNLSLHPSKYILLSQSQFCAADGRCRAFSEGGTGYVSAEAVGAIFLKPLADAIKDGDIIYGVVKGTAVNHGGKSNGFTVPNPVAQSMAIETALERSRIDPRTISCIEAHGTGTVLGDPVEITGLTDAFRKYTKDTGFCSISSLKSNIGHAEAAAGIAQVIKVLLQFKHKTLVKNLMHGKSLNPNIDFQQTPFIVQQKTEEWKRPIINGREVPRRAGISSFGAGGANAHIVMEEYSDDNQAAVSLSSTRINIEPQDENPYIIVLSAKNKERLRELAGRLLSVVGQEKLTDNRLADMAYTLQVGREAMEERLAVIVRSIKELEDKLEGLREDRDGVKDLYQGRVIKDRKAVSVLAVDDDMEKTIDTCIAKGKYNELLNLWVNGLDFDWNKLYNSDRGSSKPQRISLPTYPFEKKRFWIPEMEPGEAGPTTLAESIHPLVQQNTSDLYRQRFSSTFTGREFFLSDHRVKGKRVMPGVAYIEMARAALIQAVRVSNEETVRLKNMVWVRPIVVDDRPVQVHIALFPGDNRETNPGEIAYEIYSTLEETDQTADNFILYHQGRASLIPLEKITPLDLKALQAECNQRNINSHQCYEAFKAMGIDYGPAHRGIEMLYIGTGKLLAKLSMPAPVLDTRDRYVLHPSMLDSALQATMGLMINPGDWNAANIATPIKLVLPYAVQEIEIFGPCTTAMWALVRNIGANEPGDNAIKYDIDICDERGTICVRMKGFSTRPLEGELQSADVSKTIPAATPNQLPTGITRLIPVWNSIPVPIATSDVPGRQIYPSPGDRVVIVGGTKNNIRSIHRYYPQAHVLKIQAEYSSDEIVEKLQAHGSIDHIFWIAPYHALESITGNDLIEEQNQGVLHCFRMIKALLRLGYETADLGWTVITIQTQPVDKNDRVNPGHASLHGLIGSMAKEYINWKVRLVDLEAGCDWKPTAPPIADIFLLPPEPRGEARVYRGRQWYRQQLLPLDYPPPDHSIYRKEGVYVIIGGAGGIGEELSWYLVRNYRARIIWIGRRKKDETIQAKIDRIAVQGSPPLYITADAADYQSFKQAYDMIKQQYPRVHGVIHSAVVLLDQSLAKMEEDRFKAVLSSKVDVSVCLARVFQKEPLDFVLFFNSVNAFLKSPGQSNYSAGSAFEDAFAHRLRQEWSCPVKVVNWGYWGSVGVVSSKAYRDRMAKAGIGSIEPPEAMETLEMLLAGPLDQIAMNKTTRPLQVEGINYAEMIAVYREKIPSYIKNLQRPFTQEHWPGAALGIENSGIKDKVQAKLILALSKLLKVNTEVIEPEAEFIDYGFDPVLFAQFTDELNREYKLELTLQIMIKNQSLAGLVNYLVEEYRDVFEKRFPPGPTDRYRQGYPAKPKENPSKEMERILAKLLWGQLQTIGIMEGDTTIAGIKTKISHLYNRWFDESTAVLERHNYIVRDGDRYTVIDNAPVKIDAVWKEWGQQKNSWMKDPDKKAMIVLIEATLRALPEILTGKKLATDIIFPNSSMELVEGIYKNNVVLDYFNETVADIVVAYIQERRRQEASDKGREKEMLRILEIGAGTGSTSAIVLQKLKSYRHHLQEYCYTDISKAFLMYAKKEYGPGNPYLTYKIFNVEEPLTQQNIEAGAYDIVIAANVLHTTKNIRQTLRNCKTVLKKHGLILINELSANFLYTHLTIGLQEGWWRYEDPGLRIPGCPALSPGTWKEVLEREGFQSIFFPVEKAHDLGQQVIVAESDGVVRQSRLPIQDHRLPAENRMPQIAAGKSPTASRRTPSPATAHQPGVHPGGQDMLREKAVLYFKRLVGDSLGIPYNNIDPSDALGDYGLDSILVIQLANKLAEVLDNITSTLFFEYRTIDDLVDHFLKTQRDSLVKLLGLTDQELAEEIKSPPAEPGLIFRKSGMLRSKRFLQYHDPGIEESKSPGSFKIQDIAIIGLSGRYPGANDITEFWNNLKEGKNCITEIPSERWNWKEYFDEQKGKKGSIYSKWGGFIKDIDKFDPLFFQISPAEAENMDPQERLFLEVAYASIEDAGYTPGNLCKSRQIGVFVGVMNGNYPIHSNLWSIANRLSYIFDFQGPSMAVDTACSSSLTAIHLAMESLYGGTSECAIAGGVYLIVDPRQYLGLSELTMLSSTDQCKAFGDSADGFVDGEGAGAIVLKPLTKAIADNDHIYGIIKGSMLNSGGKTNGYTVPNPMAQQQVISGALQRAGVHPRAISYIEAHGTGTVLGDPIEIAGLTKAFEQDTQDKQFCAVGSVKSNIGHLESAAAIAGVTKILLQLKYRQLVPSLHSKALNPHIDFINTPFVVQQELVEWKRPVVEIDGKTREYPRIAGISSFGAGGANAHLVIEEYIPGLTDRPPILSTAEKPQIVVFSAKNPNRLQAVVQQMLEFIELQKDLSLADIAYTLQVGREAIETRVALVVSNKDELVKGLKGYLTNQPQSITIFKGNPGEDGPGIKALLSGKAGEAVVQIFLAENNLEKLALHWSQGGKIPWESIHEGGRRISLPTYPFAREHYWIEKSEARQLPLNQQQNIGPQQPTVKEFKNGSSTQANIQEYFVKFFSRELKLSREQIKVNKNILEYGVDSIFTMKLLGDIEINFDSRITVQEIIQYKTIKLLSDYLAQRLTPKNFNDQYEQGEIL
jgi:acyl transferase domain-containing protein/long-subunit acyl-CoA synthetase (AMP-forming)/ubiquinone/menaquinone biosynthesis C-methylase UbiE